MNIQRAVSEPVIDAVNLLFDGIKLVFEQIQSHLLFLGTIGFPRFNFREELFFPFIRNGNHPHIPFNFFCKFFLANKTAIIAMQFLILVGATIIKITLPTFLRVPLARDAKTARTAGGKIQKLKSFIASVLAWLSVRPETQGKIFGFRKTQFIYNGFRISEPLDDLIAVESFTATWWLHQNGLENVVGTMGADCSERRLRWI